MMQVIKLEVMVIDIDGLGAEEIKSVIENQRYPNHCISPTVRKVEVREIGEWSDEHLLNHRNKQEAEYVRLFGERQIGNDTEELLQMIERALKKQCA